MMLEQVELKSLAPENVPLRDNICTLSPWDANGIPFTFVGTPATYSIQWSLEIYLLCLGELSLFLVSVAVRVQHGTCRQGRNAKNGSVDTK